jgi:Putative Ig domain/Lipase (class 3)
MTQLNTTPGDGSLSLNVDGFGSFGSNVNEDAFYDPIGDAQVGKTTYRSQIAIRIGEEASRDFLNNIQDIAEPIITYDPNNQSFPILPTITKSTFTAKGLNFELTQNVSDLSPGQDQPRSGSNLSQVYEIKNPSNAPVLLELIRYFDGDLYFDTTKNDTGGRRIKNGQEILFETDSGENVDAQSSTTFIGITADGGSVNHKGRYEIGEYSDVRRNITNPIYDDNGNSIVQNLNDSIKGDTDANDFIDQEPYDLASALSTKYVIDPGQTVTYITNTIFGQGAPAAVVIPNRPPTVSVAIPDAAVTQGNLLTFAVPSNSFSDPDGDTLAYKASLENGDPLPTWLKFDSSTRIFSGTPSDIGDINVKVTATDPKQASTTDIFKIKVNQSTVGVILPGEKDSIYEFLSREVAYNNIWAEKSLAGDKSLKSVYGGTEFEQLAGDYVVDRIFDDTNDTKTGFYALGLTSATSAPVLVIRGTELNGSKDILSDFDSGGVGLNQYQKNNSAISQWLSATSKSPDITGHSLGGALAQTFAAEVTSKGQQLGDIITFNSPGIDSATADKFKADKTTGVKHYIVSGDIVSLSGEKFISGKYEVFDFIDFNPASNHLRPILVSQVKYGNSSNTPSTRALDTRSVYSNSDNSSLNSKFFGYFDPEYLAALDALEIAVQLYPNQQVRQAIQPIPPALLFRGTTEVLRDTISTNIDVVSALISGKPPTEGELSIKDIKFVPKLWEIKDASLKFNTVTQAVSGSANVLIPGGAVIEGSLGVIRGQLDSIGFNRNELRIPIGTTGASLQSVGGSIKNLAGSNPIELAGNIGIIDSLSANKIIDISLPFPFNNVVNIPKNIWSLDVTGKIDINSLTGIGDLSILGGLAKGRAEAKLDWNQRLLTAKTNLSILNGFISTETDFTANSNSDIVLSGNGLIKSPNGFIGEGLSVNGKFLLQYINNNNSSDDFVASYRKIDFPAIGFIQLPSVEKSIKVSFDGKIDWSVGKEIFDRPTQIVGIQTRSLSIAPALNYNPSLSEFLTVDANQSTVQPNAQPLSYKAPLAEFVTIENNQYSVPPNAQWLILNAEWATASNTPVQVRLKSPDGKIIDEGDFAANNIAIVNDLTDTKNRSVIIAQPLSGTWSIEVLNPTGLDSLSYRAFRDAIAPTIELDPLVDTGNKTFNINYKAIDPDSSAKVSLFYSVDNQNFSGLLIKSDLSENDGASSYSWNTKELAAGDYYVYAMISDGDTAPVFKYAPGKVTVTDSVDISNPPTLVNNTPVASKPLVNASATQDQPFTLALPIGAFTDTDAGDVLTYSATLVDGSPIPTWLQLDRVTGAFTGTPTNTNLGNLQVKVNATDKANATVSNTFDLNVLAPVVKNPGIPGVPGTSVQPFTIQKATNGDIW